MQNNQTPVIAPRFYFTPKHQIGLFKQVVRQVDGERYELIVNGVTVRFRPDLLAAVPAEKIQLFKKLAK